MPAGTDASAEIYRGYERARDWALASGRATASELGAGAYLLEASPLIVERLREHCHHLGGAHPAGGEAPADGRGPGGDARVRLLERLEALVEVGGMELLVPESPLLGGFGLEVDGALYNEDTLSFYETIVALDRGGVLPELRDARTGRPLVWIPAPGWGGLAYQLKTLAPRVRCVLSGEPARLVPAATYLQSTFPDARVRFLEHSSSASGQPLEEMLDEADFVFAPAVPAPASGSGTRAPQQVELTVSHGAFARMPLEEVEWYVGRAWALGSRYLYDGSPPGGETAAGAEARRAAIERRFWLHETPVLPGWTTEKPASPDAGKRRATFAELGPPPPFALDHTLGWRRIVALEDDG